jgi:hypothetical protein
MIGTVQKRPRMNNSSERGVLPEGFKLRQRA